MLDTAFWVVVVFSLLALVWLNRDEWREWRKKDNGDEEEG